MARSNASTLLANGADEGEVREAAKAIEGDLILAQAGLLREMLPVAELPGNKLAAFINDEIASFIRLTGGNWSPEHRQEWIDQCALEFAELPLAPLRPALREARRRVHEPKRFVSWVFEFVQPDLDKLAAEGKRIERLMEIIGR